MSASSNGHVEVVKTLLQHGASVDHQKEVHVQFISFLCVNRPTVLTRPHRGPTHLLYQQELHSVLICCTLIKAR